MKTKLNTKFRWWISKKHLLKIAKQRLEHWETHIVDDPKHEMYQGSSLRAEYRIDGIQDLLEHL